MSRCSDLLLTRLSDKTISAGGWRFATQASTFGLQFLTLAVLARLLERSDFGLAYQAMLVVGLSQVVFEFGIPLAIIQRRELTQRHVRTAVTMSILLGIILAGLMYPLAPLAAVFFDNPEVIPVLRVLSLNFMLLSLGSISGALLERDLRYRALFYSATLAYGLGYGLVGITLASPLFGLEVWSLIFASIAQVVVSTTVRLSLCRPPLWPLLGREEAKELLHIGGGLGMTRVVNYFAMRADQFVIGGWLSDAALGVYRNAYKLMMLPTDIFAAAFGKVLFPVFSRIQDEPPRLERGYFAAVSLSTLCVFPINLAMIVAAPEIIFTVYGPRWQDAVLPFQILCIAAMLRSVYNIGDSITRGNEVMLSRFLRHLIFAGSVLTGSYIGQHWGIVGVAIGTVAAFALMYLLLGSLALEVVQASWWRLLRAQASGLLLGLATSTTALVVTLALRRAGVHHALILLATIAACSAAVAVACLVVPRGWLPPDAAWAMQHIDNRAAQMLTRITRSSR